MSRNKRNCHRVIFSKAVFGAMLVALTLIFVASIKLLDNEPIAGEAYAPSNPQTGSESSLLPEDTAIIIAIDAGHGGDDGGADEYVLEKDMTQQTVKYLEEYLLNDESYTPVLCRPYDDGASVASRCEVASSAKADLLLSVHGNTDPTRTATGFEAFPAPPGRKYHEQSLSFAQIIARKMGEAGQRLRGERGVRYKYYEEKPNGKTKEIIAEESVTEYNAAKSFGMVEKPSCPAVLVEQCFLTSKSDTEKWASDEGCKAAAKIYYEAICEYFGTQPIL